MLRKNTASWPEATVRLSGTKRGGGPVISTLTEPAGAEPLAASVVNVTSEDEEPVAADWLGAVGWTDGEIELDAPHPATPTISAAKIKLGTDRGNLSMPFDSFHAIAAIATGRQRLAMQNHTLGGGIGEKEGCFAASGRASPRGMTVGFSVSAYRPMRS